jgi:large subunit ribosomal protein L5
MNIMEKPKLTKIVINMGIGDTLKSKEALTKIAEDMAAITGQKPKITKARISIAGFNLRAGQNVGMVITLRGKRMNAFFEKLVKITLPRLRDFRGVKNTSFDKSGNYTLGIVDHTVFPEIDLAKVDKARGMEITIVTSTKDVEKSREFLTGLGMPFEKTEGGNS